MFKEYKVDELRVVCRPSFSPRIQVSLMSVDKSEKYNFDDKYDIPVLNEDIFNRSINLNILSGFNKEYKNTEERDERNDTLHLLIYLKEKNHIPKRFITYRENLRRISSIPYEEAKNMSLTIIKLHGNIIILCCENLHNGDLINKSKNIYSSKRFNRLITKSNKDENNDESLYQNDTFTALETNLHSTLFSHDLFYIGRILCIRERDNKFIEVKSRRKKQNDYDLRRYYFLKWYLQSYLSGIESVIVGFRNDDFIVDDIKEYDIKVFHRSARDLENGNDLWNQNECFGFLGNFLTEVEKFTEDFVDSDICKVNFNVTSKKITFTKTNQTESPQFDFLPQWFRTKWVN